VYFLCQCLDLEVWGVLRAAVSQHPGCDVYLDPCAVWTLCGYERGGWISSFSGTSPLGEGHPIHTWERHTTPPPENFFATSQNGKVAMPQGDARQEQSLWAVFL